jgi:hypothetical protein
VAVGSGVWTRYWTFRSKGLHYAREREAALPSGGQPVVERACVKRMRLPSVPSTWPTRRIVSNVLFGSSAWHQGLKEIEPVASVRFAVSCLPLPLLSASPSFSDRCAG